MKQLHHKAAMCFKLLITAKSCQIVFLWN